MRVGREFHRLPHELRDVPLHWLLWDYLALQEAQSVDEIIQDGRSIREASLHAMAVHKPSMLDKEEQLLKARARRLSAGKPAKRESSNAELREYAARMEAVIEAGRVFSDVPVAPVET